VTGVSKQVGPSRERPVSGRSKIKLVGNVMIDALIANLGAGRRGRNLLGKKTRFCHCEKKTLFMWTFASSVLMWMKQGSLTAIMGRR